MFVLQILPRVRDTRLSLLERGNSQPALSLDNKSSDLTTCKASRVKKHSSIKHDRLHERDIFIFFTYLSHVVLAATGRAATVTVTSCTTNPAPSSFSFKTIINPSPAPQGQLCSSHLDLHLLHLLHHFNKVSTASERSTPSFKETRHPEQLHQASSTQNL